MHATDAFYTGRCRSFLKKVAENDTFVFNTKINSITQNNDLYNQYRMYLFLKLYK